MFGYKSTLKPVNIHREKKIYIFVLMMMMMMIMMVLLLLQQCNEVTKICKSNYNFSNFKLKMKNEQK
jgi:hypothetical protein